MIYRYQNNFYFTQSKFKVEDNLLIQITKLLFKNQFCKEALFLLSPKTFFVNQIRDILKYMIVYYHELIQKILSSEQKSDTITCRKLSENISICEKCIEKLDRNCNFNIYIFGS
mgnify:CR=1 FL=1